MCDLLIPLCGREAGEWTVWKNGNGCNKHIRRHLMKKHTERYSDEVKAKGLKNMDISCSSTSLSGMNRKTVDGSSTEARLEHRLAQCIIANTNVSINLKLVNIVLISYVHLDSLRLGMFRVPRLYTLCIAGIRRSPLQVDA